MKWFASIARAMEDGVLEIDDTDERVNLQHSIQLYSVFVETGDKRYLELCEDFLRYALVPTAEPRTARAQG